MQFFRFICFLVLSAGVLSGCAQKPEEPRASASGLQSISKFPKDDLGREVSLKAPAQRVVCIGPGATETIFALGAGGKLVGRDQISDYPPAALKVPIAGDYTGPFVEKVVALRPDLVIVQGETYDRARLENWQEKIGAPVVGLVPTSVKKVAEGIKKIGKWLGQEGNVNKLVWSLERPRGTHWEVFSFVEVQRAPLWTAGKNTLINDVMFRSGFYNIAERGPVPTITGYKQYNVETLLSLRPVYLQAYILPMRRPDKSRALQEIRKNRFLRHLDCIQNGRVVVVRDDLLLRPGPRLSDGMDQLASQAKLVADDYKKTR